MPGYRLSKRANEDLDEILAYTVEQWGIDQADRYLRGLEALFHIISSRPMMGRNAVQVMPGLRWVKHVSHIIFYSLLPEGIQIERVLHMSKALKEEQFMF